MKNLPKFFFLLLGLLSLTTCKKDTNEGNTLPDIQMTGILNMVPDAYDTYQWAIFQDSLGNERRLAIKKSSRVTPRIFMDKLYDVHEFSWSLKDSLENFSLFVLATAHYTTESEIDYYIDASLNTLIYFSCPVEVHMDGTTYTGNIVLSKELNGRTFARVYQTVLSGTCELYYTINQGIVGFRTGPKELWVLVGYE